MGFTDFVSDAGLTGMQPASSMLKLTRANTLQSSTTGFRLAHTSMGTFSISSNPLAPPKDEKTLVRVDEAA